MTVSLASPRTHNKEKRVTSGWVVASPGNARERVKLVTTLLCAAAMRKAGTLPQGCQLAVKKVVEEGDMAWHYHIVSADADGHKGPTKHTS